VTRTRLLERLFLATSSINKQPITGLNNQPHQSPLTEMPADNASVLSLVKR
jgi:hypothetical protein